MVAACRDRGLLINCVHNRVLRLLPPWSLPNRMQTTRSAFLRVSSGVVTTEDKLVSILGVSRWDCPRVLPSASQSHSERLCSPMVGYLDPTDPHKGQIVV